MKESELKLCYLVIKLLGSLHLINKISIIGLALSAFKFSSGLTGIQVFIQIQGNLGVFLCSNL